MTNYNEVYQSLTSDIAEDDKENIRHIEKTLKVNQNLTNSQKLLSTKIIENSTLNISLNKIPNENVVTKSTASTKILEFIKDDKNNNNLSSLSEPHSNINQETLVTQLNTMDKKNLTVTKGYTQTTRKNSVLDNLVDTTSFVIHSSQRLANDESENSLETTN